MEILDNKCPNCGDGIDIGQTICESCRQPVRITSLKTLSTIDNGSLIRRTMNYKRIVEENPSSLDEQLSLSLVFLKLGRFKDANESFVKCLQLDPTNSELYYYAALSLLDGKKAFLNSRKTIDEILGLMDAAITLENKGIYYYFISYIKYDFFFRKHLRIEPDYRDTFVFSQEVGVSENDIFEMYEILKIDRPDSL